ncbi:glycosyltransferase [Fervidobacterium pennivorans]|uniref:glycosyltransferase n=1 Tax=Fervidobacterium pennivorans TaxID=93466 RepID=UPI001436A739|nr:glycosyltransferase family 2 protein [Fervidobacterium pennivorans]QIV79285.1 glycosyltransferase family 2 protein [Fervidobacterium pennivorans subsp. keratinolyticus]
MELLEKGRGWIIWLENIIFFSFLIISAFYYYYSTQRVLHLKEKAFNDEKLNAENYCVSVIIPARNEEKNLSKLLPLLLDQSVRPYEIIIVDDNSTDNTSVVASSFPNVCVVKLTTEPPKGWIGKSWAIWNGYLNSHGDYLLFLDADVEPSNVFIESLVKIHKKYGGLLSIWPYQRLEKFYEHFTLPFNLMIVYASNNLGFPNKKPSGAFGPVIFTSKKDYQLIGGHEAIKDSVLEDIKLGRLYSEHGLNVSNFLGNHTVKFRMYPLGLKQLFEGFSKNMSSGAITGGWFSFILAILWMFGIYSSMTSIFTFGGILRYFVTSIVLYIMAKPTGEYTFYDALLYPMYYAFFLIVFFNSLYLTIFKKEVYWKGRKIDVQ